MASYVREGFKCTVAATAGVAVGAAQGLVTVVPVGLVATALASVPPASPLLFCSMATTIKVYQAFVGLSGGGVVAASFLDRSVKVGKGTYNFLTDILG